MTKFLVRCHDCVLPQFERLDEAKVYPVVTNSFLVGGGDKFDILVEKTISREIGG